jgi:pimeloyl-ACP methyl ester carboxylesterase
MASCAAVAENDRGKSDDGGSHHAAEPSPRRPMTLETYGFFIAGGKLVRPTFENLRRGRATSPPLPLSERDILVGHAYVEFFIPAEKRNGNNTIPIVMSHSGRTGVIWNGTPDGREGWSQYFVRNGFPSYVVEPPGVGRAGFAVDQYNRVRAGLDAPASQTMLQRGDSTEWELFWTGPAPQQLGDGTYYGNQMPIDDESYRRWLAVGGVPIGPIGPTAGVDALIAVLEKVGPAIYIGWSGGGRLGLETIQRRPDLFKAFIGVEARTGCEFDPVATPMRVANIVAHKIAFLNINGGAEAHRSPPPNSLCQAFAAQVVAAGGKATVINLSDVGIHGNSHMMMAEKNSDQIARLLVDWIDKNVQGGQP